MKILPALCALFAAGLACRPCLQAATTPFDLQGKAGAGLLAGNQNTVVTGNPPGRGGELGAGFVFDDVTNVLSINVGWGSGNGFTDLTANAVAGHLHGPTASAAPGSFLEDQNVWIGLDNLPAWNPSATNGGFNGSVPLTDQQETALFEGRIYMNVHTPANGGGEIRGNLVPVPEPTTMGLIVCGAAGFMVSRRSRREAAART